ncbi:MAG: hypothetical protein BWK77_08400 [Verrucomicrobia bacterium A1]|nr:MAG: hypothetical protein BWK77_08400 [Verrucomicrobia bacterium A1]
MTASSRSLVVFRAVAFAAAAGGAVCLVWAARAVPAGLRTIERKQADLAAIEAQDAKVRGFDPYFTALAAVTGAPPEAPAEMLRRVAPGAPAPVMAGGGVEPIEGPWSLHRVEMTFADVPIDSVAAFLAECEGARPRWRASNLRIQALDPGGTRARVSMGLEGIVRAAAKGRAP